MFSAFPIPKGLCPPAQHKGCEQRATLRKTCRSCSLLHPERMEITQPRVARNELPWVGGPLNLNPERVLSKTLNRYRREEREKTGGLQKLSAGTGTRMARLGLALRIE